MKYPLPLSMPAGRHPIITQPYGDKTSVEWYRANGLNLTEHNGTDIVISFPGATAEQSRIATYGARIVCPVPSAFLEKTWWDSPMSTKGNGIQIAWKEGVDRFQMLSWHCSEVNPQNTYKEGDTLGFMGNSGLVRPAPTNACVHCGAHIHLMLYANGVLTDAMTKFDAKRWYTSQDTGIEKDLAPFQFFFDKIMGLLALLKVK